MLTHSGVRRTRPVWLVIALCWLVVIYDGYDLIVYGTTIPSLLKEPGWSLSPDGAGHIGSLAFGGMMIGAMGAGSLADRIGRRRMMVISVVWFSVFTGICGWADGPVWFGLFRFLGGLGLGGLVPSANALSAEFVKDKWRSIVATAMMSGVPVGGSIAAIIGLRALPSMGWHSLYFIAFSGLIAGALIVALMPESPTWLRAKKRTAEAERIEAQYGLPVARTELAQVRKQSTWAVLQSPHVAATVLFVIATAATMFAWYGLGTWLPKLTAADARFQLGNDSLTYLLALNLGAVAVSSVTASTATRFGAMRVAIVAAFVGAVSLAILTTYPSSITVVYLLLILAGVGSHGTLCLVIGAISSHYPPHLRATGIGAAFGGGRIGAVIGPSVAGWLLERNPDSATPSIAMFAFASGLAAVLLLITSLVTRRGTVVEASEEALAA